MKQKLFVLGLLLTFMVGVANAWTDTDEDNWWSGDAAEKTARQAYDANRTYTYDVPANDGIYQSKPYALDTSEYDEAVNEINTFLGANGDQMPEATKTGLKAIYDNAIAKEKAVMLDWHTQVYDENPGIANRYSAIKTAWEAALENDAADMKAKLTTAKVLTEAQILLDKVNATTDDAFFGKDKGSDVWTEVSAAKTALSSAIDTYDALDQDDAAAVVALVESIAGLEAALAKNDEACKEADQQLLNLQEAMKQVEAVLASDIPSDESKADLQAAYDAVNADLNQMVTDAKALRYNLIGGDSFYDNNLLKETAKLNAALAKAIKGSFADMFIAGLTWTYGQPLPIVDPKEAANAYGLNWTNDENGNYNAALAALNALGDDVAALKSAAASIATDYTTKQTKVNDEWGTAAFSDKQTTYTKPNQWKYNKDAWDNAIALDAQDMAYMKTLADAVVALNTAYTDSKLADTDILGGYASQYTAASSAVTELLGKDADAFKEMLLNADYVALDNINKVRANFLAAVNAIKEEQTDVNTAGEFLSLVLQQATTAKNNMDGTATAQKEAKASLETAIATAQAVYDKVTGEAFNEFQTSKDVVTAAKALAQALADAKYKYDGVTSPVGTPIAYTGDEQWVYATPEHLGSKQLPAAAGKEAYTLSWTEYEAAQAALAAFTSSDAAEVQTAVTGLSDAFEAKEAKAKSQWTIQQAWSDESTDDYPSDGKGYPFATNWSYNQDTWQSGINADVVTMKQALRVAKSLDALKSVIKEAGDLDAKSIVGDFKTAISDALTAANTLYDANKSLASIEESVIDQVLGATSQLQHALAANNEEIQDVLTAANLLEANINAAQALIDKNMVSEADKPTLQAQIDAAKVVLDNVKPANPANADFSTIDNAADVTNAYMVLLDQVSNTKTGDSHKPTTASYDWTYSLPLSLGEESAAGLALDWTRYDAAVGRLTAAQASAADVQDAAFRGIVNKILAGYAGKKNRAMADWETKAAWDGATAYAKNWSYNQTTWNAQIDADAAKIEQFVSFVEYANALYNLIGDDNNNAKKLAASTEILGAYKASLDAAITLGENVYNQLVTSNVNYADAGHTGSSYDVLTGEVTTQAISYLNVVISQLQTVIGSNTEETEDVMAAAETLNHAIKAALAAAESVEDIDGGDQFKTTIQNLVNDTPNYQKLYDNAKASNFTEAGFKVVNSETLIAAANALKESVNNYVAQYLQGITNINNVDNVEWVYAEPLRLGDNQDPKDAADPYTLDWTDYEAAQAELQAATFTAPEVLAAQTAIDGALTDRETTAQTQWTSVPAWTGTNDKFANQFQYNQTTWQNGIAEDAKNIRKATMILTVLEKMYLLNTEADALYNSKEMLQAPYLKDGLKGAYDASKALYDALTSDHSLITETSVAQCEAALVTLQAAYDAVAEETKSVKTVQPLLNSAIQDAKAAAETVEDVDAGTYKQNIKDAIAEAEKIWNNAKNNNFNSGDDYKINYAKTLTDAIRDLNKAVRDNTKDYNDGLTDVVTTDGWVYPQPLRLGTQSDPAAVDAGTGATKYTLDWKEYQNSLDQLAAVVANAQDATLKENAQKLADAFTTKKATAETQWTSKAWEGTNEYQVNQFQYNQTSWNAAIANDAKVINNVADLVVSLDSLYSSLTYAKTNLIPAADNKNVVSTYAPAIQTQYDAANGIYDTYKAMADSLVTRVDVQTVDNAKNMLDVLMGINKSEIDDIDEYRPLLWESYKVAQDVRNKIKDDAEMKYYNALNDAISDAYKVWSNADNHKYNEFKNAQEVTIARRALVLAMIKQQNLYQDSISALKDTLQETIEAARAASLVVNVGNASSTDLQNEIASAYGLLSGNAMLVSTDKQDLNITKLQAANTRLKRVYCSAFILDLDSLKAAIADAQKFYDGITPYVSYKGVEKAQTDIKAAIETAQAFLTDAEEKNAAQTNPGTDYNPVFTKAEDFNTYNTVDVPAATDALNKAHMAINLAALKAVADSIQSYVDNEKVVTLYQNSLAQVIDHANSVYGDYQPNAEKKEAFSNFTTQDKITDAIVTAIGDAQKFYAANDAAIQAAEEVRAKLVTKIADATALKDELTDAASQNTLQTAIETATTLKDTDSASPEELTNGITALDLAMKTARWTDDIARLTKAISTKEQEAEALTDEDAKEIMALYINKAQSLLAKLQTSVYTTVTTADVSAMIVELSKGLTQAQTYNNGEMMPDMLAKAADYSDLIPDEIAAAQEAHDNSANLPYSAVKAAFDALAEAVDKAEDYTEAKTQLQTAIDEAKLAEAPTAAQQTAIANAETAVAAAFTQDRQKLDNVIGAMNTAWNELKAQMDADRWSHQALTGILKVQPWRPNDPKAGQTQYIKLAGKYTSADADVANSSVDLFLTDIQGTEGTRTFDWREFSSATDYAANAVNLSNNGVSDLNNFTEYGWSYDEHFNSVVIKAGTIYSSGDGYVNANHTYGPFTWTNVWNYNDYEILDKDADGNYYGRYYTFNWTETNKGGVYRIPTLLGIYNDKLNDFKVEDIKTYISKPTKEGDYFINSDLTIEGDKGYDTQGTVFNYSNGTAILNGRWHRVQFIDKNQYDFHKAAQKAADWYNNNPDLRHYDTAALKELKEAVETKGNDWTPQIKDIEEAMEKVLNSYGKVNMIKGDSIYGVIADGDYADVQRTYTVTGAPGDAIDAMIINQTNNWTKEDKGYWSIVGADAATGKYLATVSNDSTATITVKFNPGTTYPADYREYQAILDVKVGNLNYQDEGKENLQQNLYGANPMLSLKEAELLQTHSLNLHRKDSITYDLYGRGYAHKYEKSPLKAKFYSATGLELATSEVKTTFVKSELTAYGETVDQTKFTVSYYPEDLGVDVVKVVISDTIRQADDIVLMVNAAKSEITFDPATVTDVNQNAIKAEPKADGTMAYFFPADGETYFFPIAIASFDGVNANTKVVNEDGEISIVTEKIGDDGLVEEHLEHKVQITMDNRKYFDVTTATTEINGTNKNVFVIAVKTDKLEQGTEDDGQHDGLLQIIWQDQDTIKINLNQTQPWFSAPEGGTTAGPIVDALDGNTIWEFTEAGDNVFYVDVNDVDNYYNYAVNFNAYTNTDWFLVSPSVVYQTTDKRGTRRYRLTINYNPHEVNTVYNDVLTLNVFDTNRNVIVATTSIQLKGNAVASIKGGATGVNNANVQKSQKDGKFFKNGKLVIVSGGQEFDASGAQMK